MTQRLPNMVHTASRRTRSRHATSAFRLSLMPSTLLIVLLMESTSAFSAKVHSSSPLAASVYTALPFMATRDAASEQQSQDSRWWKSLVSSSESHDDESSSVDEYLRFLERRYTRLYEDEPEQVKSFNVLEWLKQGEKDHQEMHDPSGSHDAFYALGVAGLAGKELLQSQDASPSDARTKDSAAHQVSVTSMLSSATSVSDLNQASAQKRNSSVAAAVSVLFSRTIIPATRRILAQRRVMLRMQSRRVNAFVAAAFKTLQRAPQTVLKQLWNMGGGKRNVIATCTVVAAVAVVLLHLVVQEGLGA